MINRVILGIFIFLIITTAIIFFPGSYSVDTWVQYDQAVSGWYNDWHSPALPYMWRKIYLLTGKFFSIYIFQVCLYGVFFYLLLHAARAPLLKLICIVPALFYAFIAQYIMKDAQLAIVWGIACVLLANGQQQRNIPRAAIIFLCLLYGLFLRLNTIIALLPVIYICVEMFLVRRQNIAKKVLVTFLLCAVSVSGYFYFTYKKLHASRAYPEYKLKLLDIAGISKLSGVEYMPACITSYAHYNKETLEKGYSPASIDDLYWPTDGSNSIFPYPNEEYNTCIHKAWKQALLSHPWLYLRNRTEGFLYYLKIKKRFKPHDYWNTAVWIEPNNILGLKAEYTPQMLRFMETWNKAVDAFLFDPWLWLVLNTAGFTLFFIRYRKKGLYSDRVLCSIQLSGLLAILTMLPVYQHDRDFRYTYWSVFVFIIGFVFYLSPSKAEPLKN